MKGRYICFVKNAEKDRQQHTSKNPLTEFMKNIIIAVNVPPKAELKLSPPSEPSETAGFSDRCSDFPSRKPTQAAPTPFAARFAGTSFFGNFGERTCGMRPVL